MVLATLYAGGEAVATMTSRESMSIYFEGNPGGYTKNRKAPAWRATYYVIERVEPLNSSLYATSAGSHRKLTVPALLFSLVVYHCLFITGALYCIIIFC